MAGAVSAVTGRVTRVAPVVDHVAPMVAQHCSQALRQQAAARLVVIVGVHLPVRRLQAAAVLAAPGRIWRAPVVRLAVTVVLVFLTT